MKSISKFIALLLTAVLLAGVLPVMSAGAASYNMVITLVDDADTSRVVTETQRYQSDSTILLSNIVTYVNNNHDKIHDTFAGSGLGVVLDSAVEAYEKNKDYYSVLTEKGEITSADEAGDKLHSALRSRESVVGDLADGISRITYKSNATGKTYTLSVEKTPYGGGAVEPTPTKSYMITKQDEEQYIATGEPVVLPFTLDPVENPEEAEHVLITVDPEVKTTVEVTVPVNGSEYDTVVCVIGPDGKPSIVTDCAWTENGVIVFVSGDVEIIVINTPRTFTDVPGNFWGADSIEYVTAREIFNGNGDGTFSPNTIMNRAMFATIVFNFEKISESSVEAKHVFDDVGMGIWYTKPIIWGAERSVLLGYGNGNYGPLDPITREQAAAILYRYANLCGIDTTVKNEHVFDEFDDYGRITPYAVEPMRWAIDNGIIIGMTNRTLNPRGTATRTQVATMIMRYIQNIVH